MSNQFISPSVLRGDASFSTGSAAVFNSSGNNTTSDMWMYNSGDLNEYILSIGHGVAKTAANIFVTLRDEKVGIGTDDPTFALHVNNNSSGASAIGISNTSSGVSRLYIDASNGDFSGSDYMWLGQNNDLSGEIFMAQNAGSFNFKSQPGGTAQTNLTIKQDGNVGIGLVSPTERLQVYESGLTAYKSYTTTNAGAILTAYQSTFSPFTKTTDLVAASDSTVPSEIRFLTRTSGTSTVDERMRIDSVGNVGIGTTSPLGKLQVNEYTVASQGNQGVHGEVSVFADDGDESLFLGLKDSAYPNRGWAFNPVTFGVNSDLQIKEHGATGVRMTIQSGGNVGIGTTSPDYLLDVEGSVNNAEIAIRINNTFDDNLATSNPTSVLWLNAASNNGYLRVHGAPANTAAKHQIDLGSTAGSSFLTFSPGGAERMRIATDGAIQFNDYGAGTLVSDASGNITVSSGGGAGGPFLPLTAGSTKKLTDTLYIQGTNTTNAESVLLRGVSSNDGDFLGSIRTANTGGYNQEMRFYTSDANGATDEDLTLTLKPDQSATFAGDVSIADDLTIGTTAQATLTIQDTGTSYLTFYKAGGLAYIQGAASLDTIYFGAPTSNFVQNIRVGGNIQADRNVFQDISGKGGFIMRPWGADYLNTTTNVHTGAIKITLPTGANGEDDMIKFTIDIYQYVTNESLSIDVGGYVYQQAGNNDSWRNVTAIVHAKSATENYTVRFGDDGTNHCVWVGELNTVWNHPNVICRNFYGGFAVETEDYLDEWDVSFEATSFSHVSKTQSNNFPLSSGGVDGAFLPLTGGTLTGALTGTSANFTSTVVVDNMLTIDIDDISSGENRGLNLLNSNGTDQQWNLTAGQTGVDNDKFTIRDSTYNINALTIAVNGGEALFAGNVVATNILEVAGAATGSPYLHFTQAGSQKAYIQYVDSGDSFELQTDNQFVVRTGGSATAFIINSSQNATFKGGATIEGGFLNLYGVAPVMTVDSSNANSGFRLNVTGLDTDADLLYRLQAAGTVVFSVLRGGNATFTTQAFATVATSTGDASSTLTTKGYVDSLITGATIYRGAWDPSGGGYGSPDLSGVTQTSGYYYICSADGTAEPNGTGTEPDTWAVGDWVIYNDVSGTGQWQKIDNSSVLSGAGTGQTVALWEGASSVTDSETLGNSPITVSGNNVLVSAGLQLIRTSDPFIQFYEGSTNVGDVFADTSLNNIVLRGASGHGVRIMSNAAADNSETGITLDTSYNVGIGTTSPAKKLEIATPVSSISGSSTDEGAVLRLSSFINYENGYSGEAFIGGLEFYTGDSSGSGPQVFGAIKQRQLTYYNQQAMCFFTSTYDGTLAERMHVDSTGKVGIGSRFTPTDLFTVIPTGTASFGNKKYATYTGTDSGAGSGNGFIASLNDQQGTTLTANHQYKFYITTTGTGTYNSSVYIVYRNALNTAWVKRAVSVGGSASNHPLLDISGNNAIIYDGHSSTYTVRYRVETTNSNQALTSPNIFGVDSMWQNNAGKLFYNDGNVGIGTTSPDNILHVRAGDTGYASQVGADTMLILETTNVSNSLQFSSTTSGNQYIMFGDDDPNAGWIAYAHSTNSFNFRTNGSETMVIDSSGAIKFSAYGAGTLVTDSSGNITVSSGGGAGGPYLPLAGGTLDSGATINMSGTLTIDGSSSVKMLVKGGARIALENANATDSFYIANTGGNLASILDLGSTLTIAENGGISTFAGLVSVNNKFKIANNGTATWGAANDYGQLSWDTGYALIRGQSNRGIKLQTNSSTTALTLDTSQNATFAGDVTVGDELTITTISNATADPDKFLCASGGNKVFYRTGAQVLSDIGGAPATGGSYLPLSAGSSYPLTGGLYIPSYIYHTGDENTLFGFAGQDIFIVNTGGSRRLTVTNTEATFENNLIVDGNVGIGTTSPDSLLEISKAQASGPILKITEPTTLNGTLEGGPGNNLGVLGFVSADTSTSQANLIRASVEGQPGEKPYGTGGLLTFNTMQTYAGSGTLTDLIERMRITSTGDVGIGTTSPAGRLHVSDTATLTAVYQKFTNGTTGHASGDGTTLGIDADGDFIINNNEAKEIKLYTSDVQRLTIESGGDVGIGVSPAYKLHVQGDVYSNDQFISKAANDTVQYTAAGDETTGLGDFDFNGSCSLVGAGKPLITISGASNKFPQYDATSVATTGSLNANQSQQALSADTLGTLGVDPDGNVVRGSQEGTWTFTKAQLDALTTSTTSGTTLIAAPGANKAIIIEESNWMIKYSGTDSMSTTQAYEIRQAIWTNTSASVARLPSTKINEVMNSAQGTPTNPSYGFYSRDVPDFNNDARTYNCNKATFLSRLNTNATPGKLISVTIKLKYRIFNAATF